MRLIVYFTKFLLFGILIIFNEGNAFAIESIPSKWHFDLTSTYLTSYKKGEHLISSSIYTGRAGIDAIQKYGLEVKVESWNKPYKTVYESSDHKIKEVLTVVLRKLENQKEMQAEFEDIVHENDQIKLKFSGITILTRVN